MAVQIGAFTLHRPLGQGGMGEVWLARHLHQDIEVALKLMTSERATEERYRHAFAREVRAVASLDHPAIVRVLDSSEVTAEAAAASNGQFPAGSPYLVMELAHGTLRDLQGKLSRWTQQRTILLRILDALAHAHARGVIHRDLKPENVLLVPSSDGPRLKLADFGLAHAYQHYDADEALQNSITGTPRFMAPEQILGRWRDQGPWTDLYAVGCLAYWLISGSPPYSGNQTEEILKGHLHGALPPIVAPEELPPGLGPWLKKLMAKRPEDRFQLAADAAYALERLSADSESPNAAPSEIQIPIPASLFADNPDLTSSEEATILMSQTTTLPAYQGTLTSADAPTDSLPLPPIALTWEEARPSTNLHRIDHLRGVGLGLYGLRQLPMINRISERDALWDSLRLVHSSQEPLAIAISGTQGVGKTRLAEWLLERALELGAGRTLLVRHSPIEGNNHALAMLVATRLRAFGMEREALLSRVRDFFSRSGPLDPDDLHDCMALTELIAPICDPNYNPASSRISFSSPRERYALVARFLRKTADPRPLILLLDDIQWGHDSLAFTQFLLENPLLAPPLLLLATVREEALENRPLEEKALQRLQDQDNFFTLEVPPLTEHDHRRLVQTLLGLDSSLAEQVVLRTRGNPLFAVQLVGDWVERGTLIPAPEGFQLKPGTSAQLPDDIYELLDQRLHQIAQRVAPDDSETLFQVLELAAALGLEVDLREWRTACALAGLAIPARLVDAMVLARLATAEDYRLTFLHGAIRECLQQRATTHQRWTRHHQYCALAIEKIYPPQTPGLASRIGRHLCRAHRWLDALPHLLSAADEARIASEFPTAYALFDRHLQAVNAALPPKADLHRAQNAIRRARTQVKHHLLPEATDSLNSVADLDLPPLLDAERYFALSTLARARGDAQEGLTKISTCIQLYSSQIGATHTATSLPSEENPTLGLSKALAVKADLLQSSGQLDDALTIALDSHRLATGHTNEVAASELLLGNAYGALGQHSQALHWLKKGRDSFASIGNRHGVAQIENSLGEHYRYNEDPKRALQHYNNALRLLTRLGLTHLGTVQFNIGLSYIALRDVHRAEINFRIVHDELLATGAAGYLSVTHAALMATAAYRKDWTDAESHRRSSLKRIEETALVIPDVAILAEEAVGFATSKPTLQRAFAELAILVWTRLGNQERAHRLHDSLSQLSSENPE